MGQKLGWTGPFDLRTSRTGSHVVPTASQQRGEDQMSSGTHRGIRHRIGLIAVICCAGGWPASAVRQPDTVRHVPPRTQLADTPFRLTRQVPAEVRKVCRMARAQTRVPFTCPPLVPDVPIVGTNPKGPALSGIYRIDSKGYVLTFNNGENPGTIHWIVGKGRPDTL